MAFHRICLLLLCLCGCVLTTKPKDDLGFATVSSLDAFNGCYRNRAEVGKGAPQRYLSSTIWPGAELDDGTIDAVRVEAISKEALRVTAVASGRVVRQETFVAGKDFVFESGRIILSSKTLGSTAKEPGNVFIGLDHATTTLGVDVAGNGRIQDSTSFAGTAFLIIPLAGRVHDASRFTKSAELCGGR